MTIVSRRQAVAYRDDHPACHTVAIGILPCSGPEEHLAGRCQDPVGLFPGQNVRPHLDRPRPLGICLEGDAWHAQSAGPLLPYCGSRSGLQLHPCNAKNGIRMRGYQIPPHGAVKTTVLLQIPHRSRRESAGVTIRGLSALMLSLSLSRKCATREPRPAQVTHWAPGIRAAMMMLGVCEQ